MVGRGWGWCFTAPSCGFSDPSISESHRELENRDFWVLLPKFLIQVVWNKYTFIVDLTMINLHKYTEHNSTFSNLFLGDAHYTAIYSEE